MMKQAYKIALFLLCWFCVQLTLAQGGVTDQEVKKKHFILYLNSQLENAKESAWQYGERIASDTTNEVSLDVILGVKGDNKLFTQSDSLELIYEAIYYSNLGVFDTRDLSTDMDQLTALNSDLSSTYLIIIDATMFTNMVDLLIEKLGQKIENIQLIIEIHGYNESMHEANYYLDMLSNYDNFDICIYRLKSIPNFG